jgi:hypothetical protein
MKTNITICYKNNVGLEILIGFELSDYFFPRDRCGQ